MEYITGELIQIGDKVLIEDGTTEGTILAIVENSTQMQEWGVNETGVLIKALPFGLVFWSLPDSDDPIIFKQRA